MFTNVTYLLAAKNLQLFHDGGRYHIETSPLISSANQWTDFYMITAPVTKELNWQGKTMFTSVFYAVTDEKLLTYIKKKP